MRYDSPMIGRSLLAACAFAAATSAVAASLRSGQATAFLGFTNV
jgi:hypothetical protein